MIRMSFTIKTDGLRAYQRNLETLTLVVNTTAANIEADAKQSIMARQSRGNAYSAGGRTGYHALPGNPPNTDTGNLAGSIMSKPIRPAVAEVRVGAEYAIPLEIGWITAGGSHAGPFPFLSPATERHRKPFQQAVATVLKGRKP